MKLHAHVAPDGTLAGLVAAPEGKVGAGLVAGPAFEVCEIRDHPLKGDAIEFAQLEALLETQAVKVTPAQGELIARKRST